MAHRRRPDRVPQQRLRPHPRQLRRSEQPGRDDRLFAPVGDRPIERAGRNFSGGTDLGFQLLTWSPSGQEATVGAGRSIDPGASFSWTATFADTRLIDDGMDRYSIDFWFDGTSYDDGLLQLDDPFFDEMYETLQVDVGSPVRSLDTDWLDYCDLMKEWYDAGLAADQMHSDRIDCLSGRLEGDPDCPDVYLSLEYLDEESRLDRVHDQLEEQRLAFIAEHFADDSGEVKYADKYACDCFCPYTEEITCTTIPWGTSCRVRQLVPGTSCRGSNAGVRPQRY